MPLKKLVMLFLSCSVLFGCLPKMPPITTCVLDQPRQSLHCYDKRTDNSFTLVMSDPETDKMVCTPLKDFGVILDYFKQKKS